MFTTSLSVAVVLKLDSFYAKSGSESIGGAGGQEEGKN
jgi:hypothetical protein